MSTKDDLRFHDSGGGEDVMFEQTDGQTHTFSNFPDSAIDIDSDEEGRGGDKSQLLKEGDKKTHSFWTFEYYQQFFDVETWQVFRRVVGSMTPLPNKRYLDHNIRPNPDLYGPFWICTTLVFTTAIAGNLANYLASGGKDYNWHYDFHKVTFAASAIFSYWWLIPAVLYGVLWWRKSEAGLTFLEMLCVYGYSLAIYIPISILWVVNITWFKWVLVVLGAVLSGGVLVLTFWPAMKHDTRKVAGIFVGIIFILHLALAAGFVLYFFHIPPAEVTNTTTAVPLTTKSDKLLHSGVLSDNKPGNPSPKPEALTPNKGNANLLKDDSGGVNNKPDLEGEKQKIEGEKQNLKGENREDQNNVENNEQSLIDLNENVNKKVNDDANDKPVQQSDTTNNNQAKE
ncbi:protein YIPF1-like [Mya arenaria]|uniref:protein YIPF1-like n=1 Tax=Mya arenaria TaxID=6604 RepID=UPI0022E59A31|nr:protein YIPF1-like [Mya arenaria]